MSHEAVVELLQRDVTPELYEEIRELWKVHSIAEDNRDIAGLMSTLTNDCVYELPQTGDRWEGHEGAARFYTELLTAFPDIDFQLQEIVIGPQGVFEEAVATGTHQAPWLSHPPSGRKLEFKVLIYFPWDPVRRKFRGEKVYLDSLEILAGPRRAAE